MTRTASFVAALAGMAAVAWAQPNVLIADAGGLGDVVQTDFQNMGIFGSVDRYNSINAPPNLNDLNGYDTVVFWANSTSQEDWGNALADYVDAGGTVLIAGFGHSLPWGLRDGTRMMSAGYNPFVRGPNGTIGTPVVALEPNDPVFHSPFSIDVNAMTYQDYSPLNRATLDGGALLIAETGTGNPFFAVNAAGNVGALAMYPGGPRSDDMTNFIANAIFRIPTPGAGALLVLGGVAAARRRR